MRTWLQKKNTQKRIYLDYAASTPLDARVHVAMEPYWSEVFGNPGSIHQEGVAARAAVEDARARIAAYVGAVPDEIIFTGGGTESNYMAVRGMVSDEGGEPSMVSSSIEHPSVLESLQNLGAQGCSATFIPVDEAGTLDVSALREALKKPTRLVSVMYVNNEVGTVQPLRDIAKAIRAARKQRGTEAPFLHTDASQAPLYLPIDVRKMGADLMTLDGQKLYGPKGVGMLYRRRGVPLMPVTRGGGQEGGMRPGTENVPLIVGFAKALEIAHNEREREGKRLAALQHYFIEKLTRELPRAVLNGTARNRIPNNINFSLPGIDSEFAVLWLDARGIACGSRSACAAKTHEHSHVIQAMGGSEERSARALRFTMGKDTTRQNIDRVIDVLRSIPRNKHMEGG